VPCENRKIGKYNNSCEDLDPSWQVCCVIAYS